LDGKEGGLFDHVVIVLIDPFTAMIGVRAIVTGHRSRGPAAKNILFDYGLVLFALCQVLVLANNRTVFAAAQGHNVIFNGLIATYHNGALHLGKARHGTASA